MVALANPGEGDSVADDDVRILWRSCGFVSEVYCPGSSCSEVELPDIDIAAPTTREFRTIPNRIQEHTHS